MRPGVNASRLTGRLPNAARERSRAAMCQYAGMPAVSEPRAMASHRRTGHCWRIRPPRGNSGAVAGRARGRSAAARMLRRNSPTVSARVLGVSTQGFVNVAVARKAGF